MNRIEELIRRKKAQDEAHYTRLGERIGNWVVRIATVLIFVVWFWLVGRHFLL